MPSGHVTIDILQFPSGGFRVPNEAPFSEEDFGWREPQRDMLAQFSQHPRAQVLEKPCPTPLDHDGWHRRALGQGDGECGRETSQVGGRDYERTSSKTQAGTQELEGDHGQNLHPHAVRRKAKLGLRMVPLALTFGAIYASVKAGGGQSRDRLQQDHPHCQASLCPEEQGSTYGVRQHLHPPEGSAQGRGKQVRFLHHLQAMPQQVGIASDRSGNQGRIQERKEGPLEPRREGADDRRTKEEELSGLHQPRSGRERPSDQGDPEVYEGSARRACDASARPSGRNEHSEDCNEREGGADAGDDARSDEAKGGARTPDGQTPSRGTEEDSRSDEAGAGRRTSLPLQGVCNQVEKPDGGPSGGKTLLDMQDGPMRVLSMGGNGDHPPHPKVQSIPSETSFAMVDKASSAPTERKRRSKSPRTSRGSYAAQKKAEETLIIDSD